MYHICKKVVDSIIKQLLSIYIIFISFVESICFWSSWHGFSSEHFLIHDDSIGNSCNSNGMWVSRIYFR